MIQMEDGRMIIQMGSVYFYLFLFISFFMLCAVSFVFHECSKFFDITFFNENKLEMNIVIKNAIKLYCPKWMFRMLVQTVSIVVFLVASIIFYPLGQLELRYIYFAKVFVALFFSQVLCVYLYTIKVNIKSMKSKKDLV